MIDHAPLHRDGYALLRHAIPNAWLGPLRAAFDANVKPSHEWPVPRGHDWRHSLLDLDPRVQAVCRLPAVLETVGALIASRYFISQVEGREPVAGGGHQALHRDLSAERPGDTVNALAFFDDYGPENGATRLVPGTHRPDPHPAGCTAGNDGNARHMSGSAGDILVFDADLLHAGSCNVDGTRRRSILISYKAEALYHAHLTSARLRGIRMDCSDRFAP